MGISCFHALVCVQEHGAWLKGHELQEYEKWLKLERERKRMHALVKKRGIRLPDAARPAFYRGQTSNSITIKPLFRIFQRWRLRIVY